MHIRRSKQFVKPAIRKIGFSTQCIFLTYKYIVFSDLCVCMYLRLNGSFKYRLQLSGKYFSRARFVGRTNNDDRNNYYIARHRETYL